MFGGKEFVYFRKKISRAFKIYFLSMKTGVDERDVDLKRGLFLDIKSSGRRVFKSPYWCFNLRGFIAEEEERIEQHLNTINLP